MKAALDAGVRAMCRPVLVAAPRLMGRLRVDDVETRLRAARGGRGVAQLLSYQVADELASGKLVRLLQAWEAAPLPVHLVTKGRAIAPPRSTPSSSSPPSG